MKTLLLSLILLFISGCASLPPPSEKITQAPDNDITLSEVSKDIKTFLGSPVRWGGRIVKTEAVGSGEDATLQVEVLEYPISEGGRPQQDVKSTGNRFVATIKQPFKRSQFNRNKWVSMSGDVSGEESYDLKSGEEQLLPIIDVAEAYTWPTQEIEDEYRNGWWPRTYLYLGYGRYLRHYGGGVRFAIPIHKSDRYRDNREPRNQSGGSTRSFTPPPKPPK